MAAARPALARRYAEALFDVLGGDVERREALALLRRLAQLWREERELRVLLAAPHISPERRVEAISRLLEVSVGHPLDFFLAMLFERRRHDLLPLLPEAFEAVMDERAGVARVIVTTATPLDRSSRARLARLGERLAGQPVRLEERVRPEVLGGLSLRLGDRLLDFTLRTLLSRMVERVASASLLPAPPGE